MVNKYKKIIIAGLGILLFSACSEHQEVTYHPIPKLTQQEANKYEKQYLQEYEKIKQNYKNNEIIKWIQAANKKEPCKVFVGISLQNDRTNDPEYKIFWDGKCKNGYAYGLGREFERGTLTNMNALAIYSGKRKEPKYYIQKYNLNNILIEGDLNNNYYVKTFIKDERLNFDINYQYGFFGSKDLKPARVIYSSPFSDNIVFLKAYPNFAYRITDFSKNEFDTRMYQFYSISKGKYNGFGFVTYKNSNIVAGEMKNGKLLRKVNLPKSYFDYANSIFTEIKQAGEIAIKAQQQAFIVKKQYKMRICKDSVKVNFIDNKEYKEICHENEYFKNLKEKIDNKLAQINLQKERKRQQMQQQQIIQARQMEAIAAQRRAAAAEQENTQRSWDSLNRTIQNVNTNMNWQNTNFQLMQMNNYLRYGY